MFLLSNVLGFQKNMQHALKKGQIRNINTHTQYLKIKQILFQNMLITPGPVYLVPVVEGKI